MNLKGIVHPEDSERDVVDLLYFPTGGGKTEAYLDSWPLPSPTDAFVPPNLTNITVTAV